jgi:hypothetical protein
MALTAISSVLRWLSKKLLFTTFSSWRVDMDQSPKLRRAVRKKSHSPTWMPLRPASAPLNGAVTDIVIKLHAV